MKFALFVTLVVAVGFGALTLIGSSFLPPNLAVVSCAPGQFCGGSVTPTSVQPGGAYTIQCNYGYHGDGIKPLPGSGSCTYSNFSGNTAIFNCKAGNTPGTFTNSCSLDAGSPYAQKQSSISSLTVQCPAGTLCGASVTPNTVSAGSKYSISCNYGYNGNGIAPKPGSGTCTYSNFDGNTANFTCTAGNTAGTFQNSCALNSGSPYPATSTVIEPITITGSVTPTSTQQPPTTGVSIPSNAISSGNLDGNSLWKWEHDTGTSGSSVGTSIYPLTIGGFSDVREYTISTYSSYGGERYSVDFTKDTASTHFLYDVYVMSPNPSVVGNLELDMNQVTADGKTVIYGTQCANGSKTWEYTINQNGHSHWVSSNVPCNFSAFTPNTWYHIQLASHRDSSGNVTYDWVAVNGKVSNFQNASANSALSLGWTLGVIVVNFQLDPKSSTGAPIIMYAHDLTIYRW